MLLQMAKGVFMHMAANGSGSINWQSCKLKWNYGADGIFDACQVTVKVFAIEMVYVPTNAFYIGDGDLAGTNGRFCAGTTGTPYQVTAGNLPAVLGGGTAASLGNNNAIGMNTADDFNNATSVAFGTIASWPNGYNKFYSMKYEISQEQYKEFLNTLNGTQQSNRTPAITVGAYHCNAAGTTTPQGRNGIKCTVPPSGATGGQYVCDLNNNGVYDEVNGDGRYVACNWLTTPDFLAYMDWSCLRPMTELEMEKACRGTLLPVADEFAWGSTTATAATGVTSGGADVEVASNAAANVCYSGSFATGPMRCGVFATATSTRAQAGASYYGIMEMTGNVWEQDVTIGNVAGRSFTGANGDGTLAANGAANVGAWPGANGNNTLTSANGASAAGNTGYAGMGFALGTWNTAAWAQVADRQYRNGWNGLTGRDVRTGGRGVRTAP
jgi:formylglycine-generating enzyme required for sulfatase activity